MHIEDATNGQLSPQPGMFQSWATALDSVLSQAASVCLRLVNEAEMAQLNETYRGKPGATNVLAFCVDPEIAAVAETSPEITDQFLGDLAICADVVEKERLAQQKSRDAHWAHLFIHGVLHLLGYDHLNDDDAEKMETMETELLQSLNFPAPYEAG